MTRRCQSPSLISILKTINYGDLGITGENPGNSTKPGNSNRDAVRFLYAICDPVFCSGPTGQHKLKRKKPPKADDRRVSEKRTRCIIRQYRVEADVTSCTNTPATDTETDSTFGRKALSAAAEHVEKIPPRPLGSAAKCCARERVIKNPIFHTAVLISP